MNSIELVALLQVERERYIRNDRLARLAVAVRACCSPSRLERFGHLIRRTTATR